MHISCPRCDKVINAKDYNLFEIWTCPKCEWRFRGVHADQPHFRNLINSFIAPYYTNSDVADLANCPHCGSLVDLLWIGLHTYEPRRFGHFGHKGYNGPYVCRRCGRDLPWDYPDQFQHVAKEWNKQFTEEQLIAAGVKPSVKPAVKPDSSINFAEAAKALYKKKHNL